LSGADAGVPPAFEHIDAAMGCATGFHMARMVVMGPGPGGTPSWRVGT